MKPAIFMDRDGTLCHEVGYVNHLSRFRLYPYAVDAVRLINASGFLAVVVTNQAGVARGYFPEALVHEVHGALRTAMDQGGARLDGLYVCLHHPSVGEPPYRQECDCRKPRPGLLRQAEADLGIDLRRSWMVGDRLNDLQVAWNAGGRAALVRTGYGLGELTYYAGGWPRQPDLVADHLLEAVQKIVAGAAVEGARA
jgi:D-glycero-D-manno-heptose 1,7-bisphosphate phosphatase